MSFLYPRSVSVSRPAVQSGVGAQGYGGELVSTETPVASGLPASIQMRKQRGPEDARLPGDAPKTEWYILIPASAAALGLIQVRDVVTDDLGIRYQVIGPYWNGLGYRLTCDRLES